MLSGVHGLVIQACNAAAEAQGIAPAMSLADARALYPALKSLPADIKADQTFLTRLARWCERYSPWVALDGDDGIRVDISGCAHLLGGEAAMLRDWHGRLARAGVPARLAIADTMGAAHALARYGNDDITIASVSGTRDALAPLPVAALRLEGDSVHTLNRLGLKQIGQLACLPRSSLARRFTGKDARLCGGVLKRLDQALGQASEPLTPLDPPPQWLSRQSFADPVTDLAALTPTLRAMFAELCDQLAQAHAGIRRLSLRFFRVDGSVVHLRTGTSAPTRDPRHCVQLFAERLAEVDPGFGIDMVVASVDATHAKPAHQHDLTGEQQTTEDLAQLIDRLSQRLGTEAVGRLIPMDRHIPEQSVRHIPGVADTSAPTSAEPRTPPRPLRLLSPAEPVEVIAAVPEGPPRSFRWRRMLRRVARAEGPERISPPWWQNGPRPGDNPTGTPRPRDYYRIEDDQGVRLWMFREGLYQTAEREGAPAWFVHGLDG